ARHPVARLVSDAARRVLLVNAAPPQAGPRRPVDTTPPLPPRSARRTWSLDVTFPDGLDRDPVVDVRGRDVRAHTAGEIEVSEELAVRIHIAAPDNEIVAVDASRSSIAIDGLVGSSVRGGFGRHVAELFPEHASRRSLSFSALEDLAG